MASPGQPFEWNYFPLLTGRIVLSNKKRNFKKYSVVWFEHFPKKKIYGGPYAKSPTTSKVPLNFVMSSLYFIFIVYINHLSDTDISPSLVVRIC